MRHNRVELSTDNYISNFIIGLKNFPLLLFGSIADTDEEADLSWTSVQHPLRRGLH